ncbi:retrovirus-related pol polyprotein from transposon TNT 1-94 [Tanacetum coccineum]
MKHSIEEIVSHDEEEEVESFQDKYEHADQKHKLIKMIQDKEMMQDESSQALKAAVCQEVSDSGLSYSVAVCHLVTECAGSDTRPPMRDRSDFESWKQRIRFYCLGKDNGENILNESLLNLHQKNKKRFKADNRATNILLQGLPKDIYTLINHYIDAKDIWDNVKMLLEGSELTKVERESQLYDEFEHFLKLNRGLRTSNYDQMYAYLKQHKAHANENKMMLERYTQHAIDPLAFGRQNKGPGNNARGAVAAGNVGFQNRVGNANPGQAKPIKCYNCNGIGHISRQCTHPKRPQNSKYFKDKMLLMQAKENGVVLDEKQLLFIAGGQTNTFDDVDEAPLQYLELNEDNVFQADQCDAFESDVDEAPTAQTMFMANLSSTYPIYDETGPSYD